jgi:hypothetical protein
VFCASKAFAEPPTVAIDCPAFDAETRAALDARTRAELLVRNESGTLVVKCAAGGASLDWHPMQGPPRTASAVLDTDARTSLDRILEALDFLLSSAPAGPLAAEAAGEAPSQPPAAATPLVAAPKPPEQAPPPPNETPPDAERARRGHANRFPLAFGAGAAFEFWSGNEALGGHLFASFPLPSRFSVSAGVEGLWALRSPDDVDAHLVRIAAGGDYGLDAADHFRVGADAFVDLVHAGSPTAGSDDKVSGGLQLRATAGLTAGIARFQIGPTLAIHPAKVLVDLGGTELFHIPVFTAGLLLDAIVAPF